MGVGTLGVLLASELGLDLEGVGTEVITLGLEQVGGQILGTVTVEPRQSGGEGRGWDSKKSGLGDDIPPAGLGLVDSRVEEVVEEQVLELRVVAVGGSDILQEDGSDDATSSPHQSDGGLVELPAVLLGGLIIILAIVP